MIFISRKKSVAPSGSEEDSGSMTNAVIPEEIVVDALSKPPESRQIDPLIISWLKTRSEILEKCNQGECIKLLSVSVKTYWFHSHAPLHMYFYYVNFDK